MDWLILTFFSVSFVAAEFIAYYGFDFFSELKGSASYFFFCLAFCALIFGLHHFGEILSGSSFMSAFSESLEGVSVLFLLCASWFWFRLSRGE